MATTADDKHNLPIELLSEILSRTPSKSLLRFRSVSKSWKSLIGDPTFPNLHINNFRNNSDETSFVVTQCQSEEQVCVIKCTSTFKTKEKLELPDGSSGKRLKFCCALDGLVLISYGPQTHETIILWNPSIRKSRPLPPFPVTIRGKTKKSKIEYQIGFDLRTKDYKVVRFVKTRHASSFRLDAVYSLRTGVWKAIQCDRGKCMNWSWYFSAHSASWSRIYFKGALYYTCLNHDSGRCDLVSFDLDSEVFRSISLPEIDDPGSKGGKFPTYTFVDGGDSLDLRYVSQTNGGVWVQECCGVDTDSPYWDEGFTYVPKALCDGEKLELFYLMNNCDMLDHLEFGESYIPEPDEEETLLLRNRHDLDVVGVHCYVESLLLLTG